MASAAPVIRLPLQTGQWAAASFTNDVIGTFWHMDSVCQETWTKCGPYASRIKSNLITYEHKIFQHGTANALCRHRNIRYHFQSRMALYFFLSKNGNFFRLFLVGDNIVLTFRNSTWVIYKKKHTLFLFESSEPHCCAVQALFRTTYITEWILRVVQLERFPRAFF